MTRGARLAVDLDVFGVLANQMPPNCEVLVRSYVGDQCFGLIADPARRALFLASPWGFWRLDTQQLVTTFAEAVAEWKRGDDVTNGRGLTGKIVPITSWFNQKPSYVRERPAKTARAVARRRAQKRA